MKELQSQHKLTLPPTENLSRWKNVGWVITDQTQICRGVWHDYNKDIDVIDQIIPYGYGNWFAAIQ